MDSRGWSAADTRSVVISTAGVDLAGDLSVPEAVVGVVLFAHGSGSSRHSARNRHVAAQLQSAGFATLLLDLLTSAEEEVDLVTREHRFDLRRLADRLVGTTGWLSRNPETEGVPVGYFGASTGGGAALVAAAELGADVAAVVSRGGRPDLAHDALPRVRSPTLLIVGSEDVPVIGLNEQAMARMTAAEVRLEIVPGATHLFEEPGKLEEVSRLAADWFRRHLLPARSAGGRGAGR